MANNTMTMNKTIALHKLLNLQSALADCGIESEIAEWENVTDNSTTNFLSLRAELWNCIHDGDVTFEVYAEDTDDYEEIQHYAQSEYEDAQFCAELNQMVEDMENADQN